METHQLFKLLVKDHYTKKTFCGVIPINHLPVKKLNQSCSFIVNTEDSTKPGEHWFAIYAPKYGKIEYFDSYGLKPINQQVYDFISVNRKKFIYNSKKIQGIDSENCGKYAVFYLFFRNRGLTLNNYSKFFTSNKKFNDKIINSMYKKYIK